MTVVSHGWHTDLALPAADLTGGLARFRTTFPGLETLVIGFGRRTFLIAPVKSVADLLIGPFPGDGALEVLGLTAPPSLAYRSGTLAVLRPSPEQVRRLNDAVWASFRTDAHGRPLEIAPGLTPGSVFYATGLGYSGLYTCNSWTADMLARAGLPISPDFEIFAAQTMQAAASLAPRGLCRLAPPTPPAASPPALPVRSAG